MFALSRNLKKRLSTNTTENWSWTAMMIDRLGKWLFPRWQPYRRKRETRMLVVALGVGLLVAAIMSAIIVLVNSASLGR
jgi:hypothetical protein